MCITHVNERMVRTTSPEYTRSGSGSDCDDEVAAGIEVAATDVRVGRMLLEHFARTQFELNPIRAGRHLDGVAAVAGGRRVVASVAGDSVRVTFRPISATDLSLALTVPEIVAPRRRSSRPANGWPGWHATELSGRDSAPRNRGTAHSAGSYCKRDADSLPFRCISCCPRRIEHQSL